MAISRFHKVIPIVIDRNDKLLEVWVDITLLAPYTLKMLLVPRNNVQKFSIPTMFNNGEVQLLTLSLVNQHKLTTGLYSTGIASYFACNAS